ncbi:alpha/beta hydrolase domain-containing protein 17B-like [Zalophus californianus]|uniref:Alpha/beta hydrolase domain-containing protein 17B-like n=1 Tax=Zalophus californianus TaxID=9704 RepID=A0A6J2CDV0_ZALCA|nr:alpha/beta hydrolase domain-containing protein 17B-like [Zalophus californianus]
MVNEKKPVMFPIPESTGFMKKRSYSVQILALQEVSVVGAAGTLLLCFDCSVPQESKPIGPIKNSPSEKRHIASLEKNLYADIEAAWLALMTRYGIHPENVSIYGHSRGTGPSVGLAAQSESAAATIHSPLTSGMGVTFPDTKKTYCLDAFPNIDKNSKITSPVLIIHGAEDEVNDFSHGLPLFEHCQRPMEPLWVKGAGHNDVELYGWYLERLNQFVSQELEREHKQGE